MLLTLLLDELWLGFVNYMSWQQILWLQTACLTPEPDPPDGGTPVPRGCSTSRACFARLVFYKNCGIKKAAHTQK